MYQNLFFLDVIKADILWKAKVLSEGFDSLLILSRVRCHVSSIPTNYAEKTRLWSRIENTGHSGHTN